MRSPRAVARLERAHFLTYCIRAVGSLPVLNVQLASLMGTDPRQLRQRCALCSATNEDLRRSVSSLEQGKASLEEANRLLSAELSEARKELVSSRASHKQCAAALTARESDLDKQHGELNAERRQAGQLRGTIDTLESKLKTLAPVLSGTPCLVRFLRCTRWRQRVHVCVRACSVCVCVGLALRV